MSQLGWNFSWWCLSWWDTVFLINISVKPIGSVWEQKMGKIHCFIWVKISFTTSSLRSKNLRPLGHEANVSWVATLAWGDIFIKITHMELYVKASPKICIFICSEKGDPLSSPVENQPGHSPAGFSPRNPPAKCGELGAARWRGGVISSLLCSCISANSLYVTLKASICSSQISNTMAVSF